MAGPGSSNLSIQKDEEGNRYQIFSSPGEGTGGSHQQLISSPAGVLLTPKPVPPPPELQVRDMGPSWTLLLLRQW